MHAQGHRHTYVDTRVSSNTHIHTHTNTGAHKYMHTKIHVCIHTRPVWKDGDLRRHFEEQAAGTGNLLPQGRRCQREAKQEQLGWRLPPPRASGYRVPVTSACPFGHMPDHVVMLDLFLSANKVGGDTWHPTTSTLDCLVKTAPEQLGLTWTVFTSWSTTQ